MEKIKATRMEYLKLKKRLKTAEKGHKLLKEKRDGLVKKFLGIISKLKQKTHSLKHELSLANWHFVSSTSYLTFEQINEMLTPSSSEVLVEAPIENVMSVWIPSFKYSIKHNNNSYSDFMAPWGIDSSIDVMKSALNNLIEVAGLEHSARLLSFEIEKTRKRVNALEYIVIPDIKRQIKIITAKLDEAERSEKVVRMKLKELIS